MNIEKAIRDALSGMTAVTAIVSTRIWDEWFRSAVVPSIMFESVFEDPQNDLTGKGELFIADWNLICRADTRKTSRTLSEAVRTNGTSPGTGLAGWNSGFTAILESRQMAATPKAEGSNDYWYDTYMSFWLSWLENS